MVFPRQVEFLEAMYQYDAVLYGGSMGSGKTYILLWSLVYRLAQLAADGHPHQKVALFSSTYSACEDRHLGEIGRYFPEWLGSLTKKPLPQYQLSEDFGGGIIAFRNVQDVEQYKSSQFAMIAIDELTELTEDQFNFLMTRKHRNMEDVPVVAATNPTGIGRAWVAERFGCIDPNKRDMPRDIIIDGRKVHRRGFHFIKALPQDNPTMSDQARAELASLPDRERRAFEFGDWTVFQGQYFDINPQVHIYHAGMQIPEEWERYRSLDKGMSHPTVCLWGAVDYDGTLWVYREYSVTPEPGETLEKHKRAIASMGVYEDGRPEVYRLTVGDRTMFGGDRSAEGNKTAAEVFNNRNDGIGSFRMVRARNADRTGSLVALKSAFGYEFERGENAAIKVTRWPRIRISSDCPHLISSIRNAVHNPKKEDDIIKRGGVYKPGTGDDELDALRYLWLAVTRTKEEYPDEAPPEKYQADSEIHRPELSDRYVESSGHIYKNSWAS